MHAVTRQHGPSTTRTGVYMMAMFMVFMSIVCMFHRMCGTMVVVFVPVVPQLGFVEQEEKHQATQQNGKKMVRVGLAFKRLRQQMHKGGCQQSPRSQAQKMLRPHTRAAVHAQTHQHVCNPHAADTRSQSGQNDSEQGHGLECLQKLA